MRGWMRKKKAPSILIRVYFRVGRNLMKFPFNSFECIFQTFNEVTIIPGDILSELVASQLNL